jgi:hypothetical protein
MNTSLNTTTASNNTALSPPTANAPQAVDTTAAQLELITQYQRRGIAAADPFAAVRALMLANAIGVAFERAEIVREALRRSPSPTDYVVNGLPAIEHYSGLLQKVATLAALDRQR